MRLFLLRKPWDFFSCLETWTRLPWQPWWWFLELDYDGINTSGDFADLLLHRDFIFYSLIHWPLPRPQLWFPSRREIFFSVDLMTRLVGYLAWMMWFTALLTFVLGLKRHSYCRGGLGQITPCRQTRCHPPSWANRHRYRSRSHQCL